MKGRARSRRVLANPFGPYDTVFAIAGLLFMTSGFPSIAPLRQQERTQTGTQAARGRAPEPRAGHPSGRHM